MRNDLLWLVTLCPGKTASFLMIIFHSAQSTEKKNTFRFAFNYFITNRRLHRNVACQIFTHSVVILENWIMSFHLQHNPFEDTKSSCCTWCVNWNWQQNQPVLWSIRTFLLLPVFCSALKTCMNLLPFIGIVIWQAELASQHAFIVALKLTQPSSNTSIHTCITRTSTCQMPVSTQAHLWRQASIHDG